MFFNAKTAVRLVHGDDFTYSGTKKELEKIKGKMREWYAIKDRGAMGSEKDEIKEVTIMGLTVRWTAGEGEGVRGGCGAQAEDLGSRRSGGGPKGGAQPCSEGRQRYGGA